MRFYILPASHICEHNQLNYCDPIVLLAIQCSPPYLHVTGQHSPHRTISTLTGCINAIPGISKLKHHMESYRIGPPSTPIKYEDYQWVNKSSDGWLPAAIDINN